MILGEYEAVERKQMYKYLNHWGLLSLKYSNPNPSIHTSKYIILLFKFKKIVLTLAAYLENEKPKANG